MDCFVNNNTKVCRNIGAHKCELKYKQNKDPDGEFYEYRGCIREVYSQYYGQDSLEYCRFEFGNSSGIHEDEERTNLNLDDIDNNKMSYVSKMYNCFKKSSSIKEFCEDVKTSDEMLLSCFQKLKKYSTIQKKDIDNLEAKIACKTDSKDTD